MKNNELPAGVIQLLQWTMMPDGTTYMQAWAKKWVVITNSQSGIEGLRTTDKFHVACYDDNGKIQAVFPGCQVKGRVAVAATPSYKGGPQAYGF